ncbi:MAG: DUF438 domain-containing protein [Thermoleophilia bacterium]
MLRRLHHPGSSREVTAASNRGRIFIVEISPKTRIDALLSCYPFLLEFFLAKSPKYKLLKNPVSRKTVGKVASLAQVASIGDLDLDQLLLEIAAEIRVKTGEEVTAVRPDAETAAAGSDSDTRQEAPEDREARQEILKDIIRDLHDGEDMDILKQRFKDLIKDVDASEIAVMEQGLIAEGMPESEIKRLCDVHVGVFQESLEAKPAPKVPKGHPVYTYTLENRAAENITREIALLLDKAGAMDEDEFFRQNQAGLESLMTRLADINLHYLRKENQLFPILEQYEIIGPSQVMWALHDDIRDAIRTAREELAASKGHEAINTIKYLIKSIDDMVYKEENILFPMALETLSDSDWQKVAKGEGEIGFAWIETGETGVSEAAAGPAFPASAGEPGVLELSTGQLTPQQVNLLLTHLPVEVSFVDENDEVRYYSQVEHKIFPRSPGVIGRRVQNCHPSASLDKVQKIIDEFRSGSKDVADFWIEMKGRFIYIRYFAIRDDSGTYKGTLEVVQDVTGIRALTGQQTLLDWE